MLALIQTIAFSKAPHQQKASQRLNSSPVRSLVIELWTGCIIFLQWTGEVFIWEAFHINDSGELFSFPQIGWYATSKYSLWKTLEHQPCLSSGDFMQLTLCNFHPDLFLLHLVSKCCTHFKCNKGVKLSKCEL